jgi:hypothetical protein
VAALALLAVPSARASGDTIKAAAGIQFSGVVDRSPTCTPTSATIAWGDGTTSPGTVTNSEVSGSHTYATSTTFNGTVTLIGCPGAAGPTIDTFTATVGPHPQFTQCPPIDKDFGCQFLVVVTPSGTSVAQDSNQPAVDNGGDDSLIGIQNNSSAPISSVPLSVPHTTLFGFEQDGLCNPGSAPVPSGCAPTGSSTAGTPCSQGSNSCAFPPPSGQPAGYIEPGNYSGSTQNGYEGPTSWFSNLSADLSSGRVNFSPALQPGQSTYFSLEEPPVNSSINVGASPTGVGLASPPTVSSTSARFSGVVNPNGSATTAYFQYGLDARYHKLGTSGPVYDHKTPVQAVGGDLSDHFVAGSVSGLVPNAIYWVRLVATNKNGIAFGQDIKFTTKKSAPPGPPTIGKNFNVSLVRGLVLIRVNGQFIPLTQLRQFAAGTEIDARNGALNLMTATGKKRQTQSGTFFGAIFKIGQTRSGADKGLTILSIVENAFKGAPTYAKCPKKAADGPIGQAALSSRVLQTLRGNARGKFRTVGRFAAATVRGTDWGTLDRCDGTLTRVRKGTVSVSDFVHHVTVIVTGGHSYLAKRK